MIESAIIGGALIGLAAAWLFASLGRVAGISGIVAQALSARAVWPIGFIVGMGGGAWLANLTIGPPATSPWGDISTVSLIAGGLIVGFGTRLGSGCTSGHGVCGMARLSPRSLAATVTFVGVGMLTASVLSRLGGAL